MAKVECIIERLDDPNRNESVIFVRYGNIWKKQKSFIANGKLLRIWLEVGRIVKISSCGQDSYSIVTRNGLRKVRKENAY